MQTPQPAKRYKLHNTCYTFVQEKKKEKRDKTRVGIHPCPKEQGLLPPFCGKKL
tara:strand:+ start:193 stop:354 length:162 start_codon:yes stop_codon:yes gene_type:complete